MDHGVIYAYTPLCGTCKIAGRMLDIAHEVVNDVPLEKVNINYAQDLAEKYQIESVPCLLILKDGMLQEKIYAFQSVPFIVEKLKAV